MPHSSQIFSSLSEDSRSGYIWICPTYHGFEPNNVARVYLDQGTRDSKPHEIYVQVRIADEPFKRRYMREHGKHSVDGKLTYQEYIGTASHLQDLTPEVTAKVFKPHFCVISKHYRGLLGIEDWVDPLSGETCLVPKEFKISIVKTNNRVDIIKALLSHPDQSVSMATFASLIGLALGILSMLSLVPKEYICDIPKFWMAVGWVIFAGWSIKAIAPAFRCRGS